MRIGLYFGTFNPIHIGHLIIANHLVENSNMDEVWMVVTPHNPLKKKSTLLEDHHRLHMVRLATSEYPKIKPSDIEFKLPQPNYTVNTLAYLQEKHPQHQFILVMGEDNLVSFEKWKNYEILLQNHQIMVYPRITDAVTPSTLAKHPNVQKIDAPIMEISATFIRNAIKENKNIRPLLPEAVWEYLDHNLFYKK